MKVRSSIASSLLSICLLVTKSWTVFSFQLGAASILARSPVTFLAMGASTATTATTTAADQQQEVQASLLLSIIRRSFPDALSLDLEDNIVQANAEGFGVLVTDGVRGNSTQLFVKRVEADKYSHKPWRGLRHVSMQIFYHS